MLPAISTSFVEHCLRLVSALAAGALLFTRPRFVLSTPFCLLSGARKRQVAVGPQAKPARHAFCHRLHRGLSFAVSLFFSFFPLRVFSWASGWQTHGRFASLGSAGSAIRCGPFPSACAGCINANVCCLWNDAERACCALLFAHFIRCERRRTLPGAQP